VSFEGWTEAAEASGSRSRKGRTPMMMAPMDTGIPEAKGVAATDMISRSSSLMTCPEVIWLSFDESKTRSHIIYDADARCGYTKIHYCHLALTLSPARLSPVICGERTLDREGWLAVGIQDFRAQLCLLKGAALWPSI
jgi:hypothetical protein